MHTTIAPPGTIADAASDMPLTLSQLSPRKEREEAPEALIPTPLAKERMSPMRLPIKRPASAASEKHHRKRSRGNNDAPLSAIATAPKSSDSSGSTSKARLPPTRKHVQCSQLSGSTSNARLDDERMTRVPKERGNASTSHTRVGSQGPAVFKSGSRKLKEDATNSTNIGRSYVSTSSKLRVARPQWDDTTEPVNSSLSTKGKKDSKGGSCVKPVRFIVSLTGNSFVYALS